MTFPHEDKLAAEPLFVNETGQLFYIEKSAGDNSAENKIKRTLKRFPAVFKCIRFIVSPSLKLFAYSAGSFAGTFLNDSIIINVGSGNSKISERVVNIDITPFENVDVVAYAHELPFKNGSVDGVIAEVLLEHVENITEVVQEFHRVLKPGGMVYVTAPFLYPFHAVPGDYNRWTRSGLQLLFSDFRLQKMEVYVGPVTTLVLSLAYFLALPFSLFGTTVYEYAAYFFLAVMFPLKFLDPLFRKFPGAHYSASIFVAVFEKTGVSK